MFWLKGSSVQTPLMSLRSKLWPVVRVHDLQIFPAKGPYLDVTSLNAAEIAHHCDSNFTFLGHFLTSFEVLLIQNVSDKVIIMWRESHDYSHGPARLAVWVHCHEYKYNWSVSGCEHKYEYPSFSWVRVQIVSLAQWTTSEMCKYNYETFLMSPSTGNCENEYEPT